MRNNKANRLQAVNTGMSQTPSFGNLGARFDQGKGLTGKAENKLNKMGYTDDQILSARQAGGGMSGFQTALQNARGVGQVPQIDDMNMSTPYQDVIPPMAGQAATSTLAQGQAQGNYDKQMWQPATTHVMPSSTLRGPANNMFDINNIPEPSEAQKQHERLEKADPMGRIPPQVMPSSTGRGIPNFSDMQTADPYYEQTQKTYRRPARMQAGAQGMGLMNKMQNSRSFPTGGFRY